MGIYSGFSVLLGLVSFAVHVSFLIVTLTAVRSRRPDAFLPFAMAAGIFLFQAMVNLIEPMFVARLASLSFSPSTGMMGMFSILFGFGAMISVIAWILMMIGLVKIASPPQEFSLNRAPGDY